jgi:N-acetylmuramoyl-L-alanine amidase
MCISSFPMIDEPGMRGAIPGLSYDPNDISIGIELENVNDGVQPYATEQYHVAVELVRDLVQKYHIPRHYVVRHADIALPSGRKTDPAPAAWNKDAFLDAVYGRESKLQTLMVIGNGLRIRQGPGVSFPQAVNGDRAAALNAGALVQVDTIVGGEDVGGENHWVDLANGLGFVTMKFCQRA